MNVIDLILVNIFYAWFADQEMYRQETMTIKVLGCLVFNIPIFVFWTLFDITLYNFVLYSGLIFFGFYIGIITLAFFLMTLRSIILWFIERLEIRETFAYT
jgi:hypothetical protein